MLPAISDFLKDPLGDNLKKVLQPSGLIAAAILLVLNIAFILVPLGQLRNQVAVALLGMSTAWQITLALLLLIVLTYLLLTMNSLILRLMTGESWASSPVLGSCLTKRQRANRAALRVASKRRTGDQETAQQRTQRLLSNRRETMCFPQEDGYIAPTALGNAMNATASYVWRRYGIDLTALWLHMETIISEKTGLSARLENERSSLDFLLNLTSVFTVFFVEYVLMSSWLGWWPNILGSFAFLFLAYITYRGGVARAISWGQIVRVAFDLYHDKLRLALGLRDPESTSDERQIWEKTSGWLLWGNREDNILADQRRTELSIPCVVSSDNAKATVYRAVTLERIPELGATSNIAVNRNVCYTVLISSSTERRVSSGPDCPANAVFLIISDPQVPNVSVPSELRLQGTANSKATAEVMETSELGIKQGLLWYIEHLSPNGACILQYKVSVPLFKLTTNHESLTIQETIEERDTIIEYSFAIANSGQDDVDSTLTMLDHRLALSGAVKGLLRMPDGSVKELRPKSLADPGSCCWSLGNVPKGTSVTLNCVARKNLAVR